VDAIYAAGPHGLATAAMIDAVPVAASRTDLVQNLQPRISEHLLDVLQSRADFRRDRGFLPRRVDVRSWLDTDPLRHALAVQRHQYERGAPNPS
jgi:hypothetical protein